MGGGIGEAMLISAAVGGGTAALTGKDPLIGAGIGALGGAVGGAIAPALGGAAGEAGAIATEAAGSVVPAAAGEAGSSIMSQVPSIANPSFAGTNSLFPNTIPNGMVNPSVMGGFPSPMTGASNIAQSNVANPMYSGLNTVTPAGITKPPGMFDSAMTWMKDNPIKTAGGLGLAGLMLNQQNQFKPPGQEDYTGPLSHYRFDPYNYRPAVAPTYGYPNMARAAQGGLTQDFASGGIAALGGPNMYPGSQQGGSEYATSSHLPNSAMKVDYDAQTNPYTGDISHYMAEGGIASLGGYSDGGRLLKGPGDGMSDDIPARIGERQEARLADGEFVIPADVVSHLGNGSTDAGAKQLYSMMNKVRKARTGNHKQGKEISADKYMPEFAEGGSVAGYAGGFGGSYPQYSYADLMAQLKANPQNFTQAPAQNNQQMGINYLSNNAAMQNQQAYLPTTGDFAPMNTSGNGV